MIISHDVIKVCSLRHKTAELNWTELNWTDLNWTDLNWTELNWTELKWIVICESKSIVKSWTELNWSELNWSEPNWIELNWIELNWTELNWIEMNWTENKLGRTGVCLIRDRLLLKLKLDNDKPNIKKRISPIVTKLISSGDKFNPLSD